VPIHDFDLNLLPVAVAIYEEGSITRAAIKLGMSQPYVSKALVKLRLVFGDQLFVKTPVGMMPTKRAESLMKSAQDVLSRVHLDLLSPASFDPKSSKATFSVALSEAGELLWLPGILDALKTAAPHVSVVPVFPSIDSLPAGLESGQVDLAVGLFPELRKTNLFRQKLASFRVACLLRADHPIRVTRLSLGQYLGLNHVAVRAGHRFLEFENLLQIQNKRRNVLFSISHFLCLPEILQQSDLVATLNIKLAEYFCTTNPNLRIVDAPVELPPFETQQFWHRRFHSDPANKWLRGLVKELITSK
jgi:DNA-binding transcriptional LysR family regulator